MGFIKFLYHVISIYSIISWFWNIYQIGKYSQLFEIVGLPKEVKRNIKIKGSIGVIYILYWIYFIFIG